MLKGVLYFIFNFIAIYSMAVIIENGLIFIANTGYISAFLPIYQPSDQYMCFKSNEKIRQCIQENSGPV
tara:strand:+ start:298 stop:504 length:207 start_codon:yes stop_codon:yes gene_type:complete